MITMKKFLNSIGKAILYLLFYSGMQLIVSFVFMTIVTVCMMLSGDADMSSLESDLLGYTTIITMLSNALSLIFILLFFRIRKTKLFAEVQLHRCSMKQILAVGLFGISFSYFFGWVIEIIPFPESLMDSFVASHDTLSMGNPFVNFISVAILAPIVEEVFFRGLIYTRLKAGMNIIVAAILSAIMFGVMHGEIIWILYAFVVGIMLVWVFETTNSLLPCIVIHIANNSLSQLTENMPDNSVGMEYVILIVSLIVLVVSTIWMIKSGGKYSFEHIPSTMLVVTDSEEYKCKKESSAC